MSNSSQSWLTKYFRRSAGDAPQFPSFLNTQNPAGRYIPPWTQDASELSNYIQVFLERTADCVVFLDRHWRLTYCNKRAIEELRIRPEILNANLWEAFPEAIGSPFEIYYRRAVAERTQQLFEAYYPPIKAWYEVQAVPVEHGLTVIFRNINDRRAAAEALRERERQLATVFGQTVVGILHRDLNHKVLMVNDRYCHIVGRSPEELNGLPMQDFTHPEDVEWNTTVFKRYIKTGRPLQIEKRYVRPDGTTIWCAVNVSFVRDDSGRVVSTITVAEDIDARKKAEEKASASHDLLQVVIDSVQDLIFVKDREGRFVFANRQLTEGFGALEGQTAQNFFPRNLSDAFDATDQQVIASGETSIVEQVIPIGGEARRFQTVKVPWRREGEIIGVIGVSRDLTERLEAEAKLIESRRQLATLIDNLPGIVYRCTVEPPWPLDFMSEGADALTGYSAAEFMEQKVTWADIIHPDDLDPVAKALEYDLERQRPYSLTYRIITRSGKVRWVLERGQGIADASGKMVFLEGIISDITAEKEVEERISWTAHHDFLTKLPNRVLFHSRLEKALAHARDAGQKVGLLLLDLDHLKEVNDTLGHDVGDTILQTVAERLDGSVRPIDTVARNGGDEFAIILPDIEGEQHIEELIRPILKHLQKPLDYAGTTIDCRASIGASIWPDHGDEAASLLKQADIALYTAKSTSRGKLVIFEPSMQTEALERAQMRQNAREAIDTGRIEPFYQPKVDFGTGRIAGFEALLRWRGTGSEIQFPAGIQAAFDDPHLSVAIGEQMHSKVVEDMRRWLEAGIAFGHVAVNASAAELRGADFADRILERLRVAGIPAHCFELEVTETVLLGRGAGHVERTLRTLSAEGVKIALDDFGTGYASLSHLKQFPVDIIKIDRSFVHDLANSSNDTAILQAVLSLGKNLGITTVAEGVENKVQADFLRAQKCDLGQGYLFGRAVPKDQIPTLISSWNAGIWAGDVA